MSREIALIRTGCFRASIVILLFLVGGVSLMAGTTSRKSTRKPSNRQVSSSSRSGHRVRRAASSTKNRLRNVRAKAAPAEPRGQRAIGPERTREIQEALIREHYLDGEPSGVWDQRTRDALTRYQAENGWQTKITPDSRALIKLGLGPRHDGLLNPDSAALTTSYELGVERPIPGGR